MADSSAAPDSETPPPTLGEGGVNAPSDGQANNAEQRIQAAISQNFGGENEFELILDFSGSTEEPKTHAAVFSAENSNGRQAFIDAAEAMGIVVTVDGDNPDVLWFDASQEQLAELATGHLQDAIEQSGEVSQPETGAGEPTKPQAPGTQQSAGNPGGEAKKGADTLLSGLAF